MSVDRGKAEAAWMRRLHQTMPSNSKRIVTSFCRVSADARS
jgi:hypothetical protein